MAVLSNQAKMLANNIKDFDIEDFNNWYSQIHQIKIVGSAEIISYVELKQNGIWKDGKLVIKDGR